MDLINDDKLLFNKQLSKNENFPHININLDVLIPDQITKETLFVSVIDDDAIIRSMLMRILQVMKFDDYEIDFEAFEDGIQFFESKRLAEKGEHFLILDGVMPVMDGIEILQKVKKSETTRNIHVLMLTGRKSETDIERALKLGADDYMTKPFSIKELQTRIERLIQRMKKKDEK